MNDITSTLGSPACSC